jgi:hypothetical protein
LLLMFRLLHESPVVEDLQVHEPHTDRGTPEKQHGSEKAEAGVFAEIGASSHESRRWSLSLLLA